MSDEMERHKVIADIVYNYIGTLDPDAVRAYFGRHIEHRHLSGVTIPDGGMECIDSEKADDARALKMGYLRGLTES